MYDDYIEKLDELIYSYTGRSKTIIRKEISNLTAPGDNYCSVMLKIDVTLKNLDNDEEEMLHVVAKCRNRGRKSFMDVIAPLQFKKEIGFFADVIPALEEFQREQDVEKLFNIFPKVLAFRRNLNGNDEEIDEHAVILMENLIEQGYANIERQIGFDLEGAKLVLKDIAAFHALPVALKLHKPEIFESTVKKYASMTQSFEDVTKGDMKKPVFIRIAEQIEECKPYIGLLEQHMKDAFEKNSFFNLPCSEPFATIVHNDLWVNNTMQKLKNGKVIGNKLVDFQMYLYANPLLDVVFFIYSSVQRNVVKENFDELINLYQNSFFEVLEELKCDTSSFEYDFFEQLTIDGPNQLLHLLFMAIPIFGRKEECTIDYDAEPMEMIKESSVTQDAKDHICFVVTEFKRRGWING